MAPDRDPWRRLAAAARPALPEPPPAGPAVWRAHAARPAPRDAMPDDLWRTCGRMLPTALALAAMLAAAACMLAWSAREVDAGALPRLVAGGWP